MQIFKQSNGNRIKRCEMRESRLKSYRFLVGEPWQVNRFLLLLFSLFFKLHIIFWLLDDDSLDFLDLAELDVVLSTMLMVLVLDDLFSDSVQISVNLDFTNFINSLSFESQPSITSTNSL